MASPDLPEGLRVYLEHAGTLKPSQNARRENGFAKEFQQLKDLSSQLKRDKAYSSSHGELECNKSKNRYKDIMPYDYTRIVLPTVAGTQGSDYINGNYIKGPDGNIAYLAVQGPLPRTVDDFWRLISSHGIQVVVMVCKEIEMGKLKCKRYWPETQDERLVFAGLEISLVSEDDIGDGLITRTLQVKSARKEMIVTQLHYTAWPDHDVPKSATPLIELNKTLRALVGNRKQQVLVHCSAGCGRTGTVCAVDYAWGLLKMQKTDKFSVYDIVADLRRQRMAMVQTKEQYELVYKAVNQLVQEELDKTKFESHTYVNIELPAQQSPTAGRGEYENCEFIDSAKRWKQDDMNNGGIGKPVAPIPAQKEPEQKQQKTAVTKKVSPPPKPVAAVLAKPKANQNYVNVKVGDKPTPAVTPTSPIRDGGNRSAGVAIATPPVREMDSGKVPRSEKVAATSRNGVNEPYLVPRVGKGNVPSPTAKQTSPVALDYEVLRTNAVPGKAGSSAVNDKVAQRPQAVSSDYEIPPMVKDINKKQVPEGLLIDFGEQVPPVPTKRHSVGTVNKDQGDGNTEESTRPRMNAVGKRTSSSPNILNPSLVSSGGRAQLPTNNTPPQDLLSQPISNNLDDRGFHTLPVRKCPVTGPKRVPLGGNTFEAPELSSGGFKVAQLPKEKEHKGQYFLLNAVPIPPPGTGDRSGIKPLALQPQQGPGPQKVRFAEEVTRPSPPKKPARSPVGTYEFVGIPEAETKGAGSNKPAQIKTGFESDRSEQSVKTQTPVEVKSNSIVEPSYELVGQRQPVQKRSPPFMQPYSVTDEPVGQRQPVQKKSPPFMQPYSGTSMLHAGSDARNQASVFPFVQNGVSQGGLQTSPCVSSNLEKDSAVMKSVSTPDISLRGRGDGGEAGAETGAVVQDLYATVAPREKRNSKERNSSEMSRDSTGSHYGSAPSLRPQTSSSSLQSFNSMSSDDQEDAPPVPEKTNDAFLAPGEEPYDNVQPTNRSGTLDRFKKMMRNTSKGTLPTLKSPPDQGSPTLPHKASRNSLTMPVGSNQTSVRWPMEEFGYLKRLTKPVGPRAYPKHWPSLAHLGL